MSWEQKRFEPRRTVYKDLPFVNRHGGIFVATMTGIAFLIMFSRPIYDVYNIFRTSDTQKQLKSYENKGLKD